MLQKLLTSLMARLMAICYMVGVGADSKSQKPRGEIASAVCSCAPYTLALSTSQASRALAAFLNAWSGWTNTNTEPTRCARVCKV